MLFYLWRYFFYLKEMKPEPEIRERKGVPRFSELLPGFRSEIPGSNTS